MSDAGLSSALSHNVRPEVFLNHWRTIRDLEAEHKRTGSAVQTAKKAAKGDGLDLDAMRLLSGLSKLDTDVAEMRIRKTFAYAAWLEMPIGSQTAMFPDAKPDPVPAEATEKHREWVAGDAGRKAGEAGHPRETNPYSAAPGSFEFAAWEKSWKRGHAGFTKNQKTIAQEMGENAKIADGQAAKNKGGRPAGSKNKAKTNGASAPAPSLV